MKACRLTPTSDVLLSGASRRSCLTEREIHGVSGTRSVRGRLLPFRPRISTWGTGAPGCSHLSVVRFAAARWIVQTIPPQRQCEATDSTTKKPAIDRKLTSHNQLDKTDREPMPDSMASRLPTVKSPNLSNFQELRPWSGRQHTMINKSNSQPRTRAIAGPPCFRSALLP